MLYTYIKQNYKFTNEDKKEAVKMMELIVEIAQTVRKNGLLFIDDKIPTYENPFLRTAMQFAVDACTPEFIEEILDKYIIFGDYTSKEMLELLLIKVGTIAIVNGENPSQIKERLKAFFGKDFIDETPNITMMINKFYESIKSGDKWYYSGTNLLEETVKILDDVVMQILIRNIEVNDIFWAIMGSSAEVTVKFLENMSKRSADDIVEKIIGRRRTKAGDEEIIIAAQKRILAKIGELKSE